jgi:hypothetical protein
MEEHAVWPIFHALQESPLGHLMRTSPALYPAAEILHIMGFIILVGSIIALDLRLLGLGRSIGIQPMARLILPMARGGFLLATCMGLLLFSADAAHVVRNPAFQMKVLLIALALVNIAIAHVGAWRHLADWHGEAPQGARVTAALSILVWLGIVCSGRLIAYF